MVELHNGADATDCHEKKASSDNHDVHLCLLELTDSKNGSPSQTVEQKQDKPDVLSAAQAGVGKELWHHEHVPANLGAAVAVSQVLREAGLVDHPIASVRELAKTLTDNRWEVRKFGERQPGDVVVRSDGGYSNIGILGKDDTVFVNRRDGKFAQMSLQHSSLRENAYVLHPPEKK